MAVFRPRSSTESTDSELAVLVYMRPPSARCRRSLRGRSRYGTRREEEARNYVYCMTPLSSSTQCHCSSTSLRTEWQPLLDALSGAGQHTRLDIRRCGRNVRVCCSPARYRHVWLRTSERMDPSGRRRDRDDARIPCGLHKKTKVLIMALHSFR